MKKIQIFAYLLFIAFTVVGCVNDEISNTLPEPKKSCKITSVTYLLSGNGNYTETIEYSNDRIVKIRNSYDDYGTYEYNTFGKVIKMTYNTSYGTIPNYFTYEHINNNLITFKAHEKQLNDTYKISDGSIEFNSKGELTKIQYSTDEYWRYEYNANGNVIKTYFKNAALSTEVLRYEYITFDDKTNYVQEDATLKIYGYFDNRGGHLSKNNYTQYKEYFSNNTYSTNNVSYEYNGYGYPTKKTFGTQNTTYQYNCQ